MKAWLNWSLSVQNFRNYDACRIDISAPKVLLLGENGAGKTNLMEAMSLLAPGRGLRRAKAEHLPRGRCGGTGLGGVGTACCRG